MHGAQDEHSQVPRHTSLRAKASQDDRAWHARCRVRGHYDGDVGFDLLRFAERVNPGATGAKAAEAKPLGTTPGPSAGVMSSFGSAILRRASSLAIESRAACVVFSPIFLIGIGGI